jgi:hypothetical protein
MSSGSLRSTASLGSCLDTMRTAWPQRSYTAPVKFGLRRPSFRKRVAARTSWKRVVRHNLGVKAPRGYGWLTNPRKAAYNRVYNRTTVGLGRGCLVAVLAAVAAFGFALVSALAVSSQ